MDRKEAYRILGVDERDPLEEIRRRYHSLMHVYHPDAYGKNAADVDHRNAQKLGEAWRTIREQFLKNGGNHLSRAAAVDPGIRENRKALCRRRLYMYETLSGESMIIDTGIYGKYYWDPDMEPFSLFLKSVNEAAGTFLRNDEDRQDPGKRAGLLHLLLQEYIDPFEALCALQPSVAAGTDGTYQFSIRCHILPGDLSGNKLWERQEPSLARSGRSGPEQSLVRSGYGGPEQSPDRGGKRGTDSAPGGKEPQRLEVFPDASGSRLYVYSTDDGRTAGQITFSEKEWYYLVTPLLLQKAARAYAIPVPEEVRKEGPHTGKQRKAASGLKGRLYLAVNPDRYQGRTEQINEEIRKRFAGY